MLCQWGGNIIEKIGSILISVERKIFSLKKIANFVI